jgi:hypothetical protein
MEDPRMPLNSTKPVVRIVEIEIKPSQTTGYRALLSEEVEATVRIEPGVRFRYALAINGSPDEVLTSSKATPIRPLTNLSSIRSIRPAWSGR